MSRNNDDDLKVELGYLRRAVEDQGRAIERLHSFVEKHMNNEEDTIRRIHRWLLFISGSILLFHGATIDWTALAALATI